MVRATRGTFLSGLLAASSSLLEASLPCHAKAPAEFDDAALLEERLMELLRSSGTAGTMLSDSQVVAVERTADQLVELGGSQKLAADGIGSWGSWLGAWDVLYARPAFAGGPLSPTQGTTQLMSARQFVYGPPDTKADLTGTGQDGGISTELQYSFAAPCADKTASPPALLLRRIGAFTKLAEYDYRLDFSQPAVAYRWEAENSIPLTAAARPLSPLSAKEATEALGRIADLPSGAWVSQISYLSEQLWISRQGMPRSSSGGSRERDGLLVLRRSDASPLLPPEQRPDLTATCAEAIFVRGAICRPSLREKS